MSEVWYGKLIFSREGIEKLRRFKTQEEATAYVIGIKDCKDITSQEDHDQLDEYFGCADQITPKDE